MVSSGIYRGSFPNKTSLQFMARLNLGSILYLCPEDPPEYYLTFMRSHQIQLLHFHGLSLLEPGLPLQCSLPAGSNALLLLQGQGHGPSRCSARCKGADLRCQVLLALTLLGPLG